MGRRTWAWARPLGGALVLVVLIQRVGAGPFLDGLRSLAPGTLFTAAAIGVGTTVCAAWRWRVVSAALEAGLPLSAAVAAYYRSQFLNCVLPGGVLGDVHRGVRRGVDAGNLGRGVRSVVWERTAGQVVQGLLALVVLLALPSPLHAAMPAIATTCALLTVSVLLAGRRLAQRGRGRLACAVRAASSEIRQAVLHPARWPVVLLTSLLVVAGHVGTFLLAAAAAGAHGGPQRLLPLALIVLLAAAIPLNVGGWGPREGMAVWVFAASGWPASTGASVATAFGVLTLGTTLPGAVVLIADRLRSDRRKPVPEDNGPPSHAEIPRSGALENGAMHG